MVQHSHFPPAPAHPSLVDKVGLDQRSKLGSNLNNSGIFLAGPVDGLRGNGFKLEEGRFR